MVTYKEHVNYEKEETVDGNTKGWTFQGFQNAMDAENRQVVSVKHNEDGTATIKVREGMNLVTKLTGYIPYLFHNEEASHD